MHDIGWVKLIWNINSRSENKLVLTKYLLHRGSQSCTRLELWGGQRKKRDFAHFVSRVVIVCGRYFFEKLLRYAVGWFR